MYPIDLEKAKVLATRTYTLLGKSASMHVSTTSHNKEFPNFRTLRVPFNEKHHYWGDNQGDGREYNTDAFAAGFNTNSTLVTNIISKCSFSSECTILWKRSPSEAQP